MSHTATDRSPWQDFSRRLRSDRPALVAAGFLVLFVCLALGGGPLAARLTGHPSAQQFTNALDVNGLPLGPMQRTFSPDAVHHARDGSLFVLGADNLGRDQLVRLLYGARTSLIIAFGATAIAVVIGLVLGLLAGWHGRWVDAAISRCIESAMAFPSLLLAIAIGVVVGPGMITLLAILALFSWYYPARIVRTSTRALRAREFVQAARMVGSSDARILRHHILPHLSAPLLVFSTSVVAQNVLLEAGLSYLGVGVRPPTASWGQMLSDSVSTGLYRLQPTLVLVPGIALALVVVAFNVLGDGIRDALDPTVSR